MIPFIVGLFIGALCGVFTAALCVAAHDGKDD